MRASLAVAAMLVSLSTCGTPAPPVTSSPSPSPSPSVSVDPLAPTGFVDVTDVEPTILLDIRYATQHNFVGRPIDGYAAPRCLLAAPVAGALRKAQAAARSKGYTLKMYDCYRPKRAGQDFVDWAERPNDQTMKGEFYPEVAKRELFADGYVGGPRSSHSRGGTVDLTLVKLPGATQRPFVPGEPLVPCTAPVERRFPDNSVDMGTGYDCFDPRSNTLDKRVTGPAREHRLLLRQLMTDAGFVNYPKEWWHYSYKNEPYPNTYFDFPVA
jgi:zinc D-Ala-D-Ala dipeptidase